MLEACADKLPPKETWIAASYGVMDRLQIVKTCKKLCCVYSPDSGNLMFPRYWRLATEKEIKEAESIKPININLWDMYN